MLVRFFRLVWPGIVLFAVVGAYALSALYFQSSMLRAGAVAFLAGAVMSVLGFIVAVWLFPKKPAAIDEEKLSMGLASGAVIAISALVPTAIVEEVVYGACVLILYALIGFFLSAYHEREWRKNVRGEPPAWFWPTQLLSLGFLVFVLFPNIVGVASVILSVLVYAPLADADLLKEMKEKVPRKQGGGVDKIV